MLKPPPPLAAAAMHSLRRLLLLPRSRFSLRLHLTSLRRFSDQPPPDPSIRASLAAWAAYDPFADRLLDRAAASASDSEAALPSASGELVAPDLDAAAAAPAVALVYDPISGELVAPDPTAPDLDAAAAAPAVALIYDPITGDLVDPDPTAPDLYAAAADWEKAAPAVALVYDPITGDLVDPDPTTPDLDAAAVDSEGETEEFDPVSDEPPPAPPAAVPEKPRGGGMEFPASGAGLAGKKKSGKGRVSWVCSECGEVHAQWWGCCQSCKAVGSMKKFSESVVLDPAVRRSWLPGRMVDQMAAPAVAFVYDPISGDLVDPDPTAPDLDAAAADSEATAPAVALVCDPISGDLVDPDPTAPDLDATASDSEGEAAEFDPVSDEPPPAPPAAVPENLRRGGMGFPASGAGLAGKKKSGKGRVSWVCAECGEVHAQWWGSCQSCKTLGSMKKFSESVAVEPARRSWLPGRMVDQMPVRLTDVNLEKDQSNWRIPLSGHFGMEVARVLGGGIVPGSLVLVGGDPGVGKSTLLLQVAANLAYGHGSDGSDGSVPVLYVSGEESIDQIRNRANRMSMNPPNLFLYSSTDIEDILEKALVVSPRPQVIIVDSIQTVYLKGVTGSAGSIMQVKECTAALLRYAKETSIPIFLIGHVTKTGEIAGPRMLEHIVDTVLYMEGERYTSYRLLRSVKNRFGSTDELGVLEMLESGLQAVSNPSEMFLSERIESDILAGLAVAVIVEGSRAFVIEIQALCVPGTSNARHCNGVNENRADMIISVIMKQAGLKLQDNAIYINVVSGVKLTETAGDLAIAMAIWCSLMEIPLPNDIAFIGEIGLGGELRGVVRMDKRVMAVDKLGYKKCIIPKSVEKSLASLSLDIDMVVCGTVKEVFEKVIRYGGLWDGKGSIRESH